MPFSNLFFFKDLKHRFTPVLDWIGELKDVNWVAFKQHFFTSILKTDTSVSSANVVSKDLDASILYQKLLGKPNVMPPSGPLPQKEIDLFKKWIEQGALNN